MGRSTNERVAVVILNWNGWDVTVTCLDTLVQLDYPALTIWVFDNGSTDDSVARLSGWGRRLREIVTDDGVARPTFAEVPAAGESASEASEADVVLFANGENLGFAGGVNRACEIALQSDFNSLWLLNNDSAVQPGTLEALVACSRTAPGSPVGSLVLHAGDAPASERVAFARGRLPDDLLIRSHVRQRFDLRERCWTSDWASFASVLVPIDLVRKRCAEDGYLLDPRLFMYVEDVEFGLYCRSIGRKIVVPRDGAVEHRESASSGGRGNPRTFYYIARNRVTVARKWFGTTRFVLFCVVYCATRLILLVIHLIRRRRAIARSVATGLIDGLVGRHGKWNRH